jgi:hypothetical protein
LQPGDPGAAQLNSIAVDSGRHGFVLAQTVQAAAGPEVLITEVASNLVVRKTINLGAGSSAPAVATGLRHQYLVTYTESGGRLGAGIIGRHGVL